MQQHNCSILTIAPYRILPVKGGGHAAIVHLHNYIGKICPDHVVSTKDNDEALNYAFDLHRVFSDKAQRYVPLYHQKELIRIGKTYDVNAIICEHPYMAISAMMLARKLKVPWFIRSHNIESERFKALGKKWWPVLRSYERFAMKQASGVFFITDEDAAWAQQHFELPGNKCHTIPYGTLLSKPPDDNADAKKIMAAQEGLNPDVPWLYFIGTLDYYPNTEAVAFIMDEIVPRLDEANTPYQLLIAGKGLPEELQQRIKAHECTTYIGFVQKLDTLLNACDVMLNPVVTGGGVKTKAVEALGYNKIVVSTHNGAAGIHPEVCGDNLLIAPDNDWQQFANLTIQAMQQTATIPQAFYNTYYWGKIAEKIVGIINKYR